MRGDRVEFFRRRVSTGLERFGGGCALGIRVLPDVGAKLVHQVQEARFRDADDFGDTRAYR